MRNHYQSQNNANISLYTRVKKIAPFILASAIPYLAYSSTRGSDNLSRHLDNQPVLDTTIPKSQRFPLQSYQEIVQFVRQYQDQIIQSSRDYKNVSPEMIVAVLIDHNYLRMRDNDWKDIIGTNAVGRIFLDPSLGPGQVKVNTAASLDKLAGIGPKDRVELERALQNPDTNIDYIARTLSDLIKNLPKSEATNLLDHPSSVAKIGAGYRRGTSGADTTSNLEGLTFAGILGNTDFGRFLGDKSTITLEQQFNMKRCVDSVVQENPSIRNELKRTAAMAGKHL